MNRIAGSALLFSLLSLTLLGFVFSFVDAKGKPNALCVTPTPNGTIPGQQSFEIDFSAAKSITLTTIYTVENLENLSAHIIQEYRNTPDCSFAGSQRSDNLGAHAAKRYTLDELSNLPATFFGEIHIKSNRRISGTSQIISKITPTATFVPTDVPTTPTPTPVSIFMPITTK